MTAAYQVLAQLVDWRVAAILTIAAVSALVAGAVGGDREDNDARGTYDAGVADEMPQDVVDRIAAAIQAEVAQR